MRSGWMPLLGVISDPQIVVTSDHFVYFYAYHIKKWVHTTTLSLESTHSLSIVLQKDTAVIGVSYNKKSKGPMRVSAYICERAAKDLEDKRGA